MHYKRIHRVGATRSVRLSLSPPFESAWNSASVVATSLKPLIAENRVGGDELSGDVAGGAEPKTVPPFVDSAHYKPNPFASCRSSVLSDGINPHGELDLYDRATGTGALSERYLRDRAAMLTWLKQFSTDDVKPIGDTFVKPQSGTPFYFEDFTSNAITTKMRIGGGDSVNAVMSRPLGDLNLIVFGSENGDVLTGQGKGERLYGGAGLALLLRSNPGRRQLKCC